MELLRFIDWLLALPEELERRLGASIAKLDRRKAMPYVTSWERFGIEKGIEKDLREAIEEGLEVRFGRKGLALLPRLKKIKDLGRLRKFRKALFAAETLDQLVAVLRDGKK